MNKNQFYIIILPATLVVMAIWLFNQEITTKNPTNNDQDSTMVSTASDLIKLDTLNLENLNREKLAYRYIKGDGLEIGALHLPTDVPSTAKVKYVDILSVEELRKHYPELASYELVNVDIVDDGEYLRKVEDETQDFVLANHFLEHCQNPIATVKNLLRVLKPGGILFMAVPDMRYTFDANRPVTTFEHLLKDYREGPEKSKRAHYEEWVRLKENIHDKDSVENRVNKLMGMGYSIHIHVWAASDLRELLVNLKQKMDFKFDVEVMVQTSQRDNEVVMILKKIGD